jgi:S-disulfanyl-L-cysteine oxidoreductase SoxD
MPEIQPPWPAILMLTMFTSLTPIVDAAPAGPGLGRAATAAEIAAWDIGITPEGLGLPEGRGSVSEGQVLYERRCQTCHGSRGAGATAEELAGAEHDLRADPPDKTIGTYWPYATTLFDFIRRAMPLDAPGSLRADEVYGITAYLLYLNRIVDASTVLDAPRLRSIRMPNREGFDWIDVNR